MFMSIFYDDKLQFCSRSTSSDVMTMCQAITGQSLFLQECVLFLLPIVTYFENVPPKPGDSRLWESPKGADIVYRYLLKFK